VLGACSVVCVKPTWHLSWSAGRPAVAPAVELLATRLYE